MWVQCEECEIGIAKQTGEQEESTDGQLYLEYLCEHCWNRMWLPADDVVEDYGIEPEKE